ncbi:MAG: hypothetical protein AB7P37_03435 [Ramlibacter sp.]
MTDNLSAPKSVILYGPQGSGKSRNAPRLARHFGLAHWREDWYPGDSLPLTNHLVLTNEPVPQFLRRCISIETAMKLMTTGQPLTDAVFEQDAQNIPRRQGVDDDAPEQRMQHRAVEIDLGHGPAFAGAQVMRAMVEPLQHLSRIMPNNASRTQLWHGLLGGAAGAMVADLGFDAAREALHNVIVGLERNRADMGEGFDKPATNVH